MQSEAVCRVLNQIRHILTTITLTLLGVTLVMLHGGGLGCQHLAARLSGEQSGVAGDAGNQPIPTHEPTGI